MNCDTIFDADRGLAGRRRAGDVYVIGAGSEAFGQAFCEFRSTIDLGCVGLGRDEDAAYWGVPVRGQNSTLLGVGQLVCATSDSTLVFSIFDIGVIPRQYNDA
ncbi:hypothetical protein GCM10009691_17390 [Brevibacterium picturae]|uniref:Uncharacterized protein n=1 Tax=Brevibacterium picturae TaxID=260553 RepID=A0ABP4MFH9_9MICO